MVKHDVEALGGSERYVLRSASALLSLGHSVYLAHGAGASQNTALFSGVISVPALFERDSFVERKAVRDSYRALRNFIQEHQVDVVHLNWMLRTAVMRRLVKHVPVVMTPHNASCPNKSRFLWRERMPCQREIGVGCLSGYFKHGCGHLGNGEPFGLPGFVRAMVEDRRSRAAIAGCHRIVAGSNWMAEYLAATGTSAAKIRVVEPPIAAVAEPSGSPAAGPPVVTFIGRLVGFKGADHVLKASQRLGIDHRLAIAGDGPDLQALITLAAELGITDRVDFLGRLDTAELESLRRRSNVVVVPALSPEVFGMVGPEALALGVPVVAYDVGGTSHWLRESAPLSTAVTVGDLDGLVTQLRRVLRESPDEAQRERIARSLADSLSPRRHAGRLLDIYREAQQAFEQGNRASVPSPGSPGQRRHSRVLPPTR